MDELAIDIRGLVKRFGHTAALDGLDLQVARGEVHGFLGPNGAGKSTTIRVLLGLLHADSGQVRMLGGDPVRDLVDLHGRVAYVPGDVNLWPNLSGGEAIDLLGRLRGGVDEGRRADLLERFDLDPGKRFDTYSKGNRQKVALIAALASRVELYLLDEPTSGLDPLMERTFRECVTELTGGGATVLLSSHILSEVEALCERVTIIRRGRTIETGDLDDMRHLTTTSVSVETDRPIAGLAETPEVIGLQVEGRQVSFSVETHALAELMPRIADAGVRSIQCEPPTLEDLFLRHYADDEGDGA
jgi:ABC-2 type transport system ATP-binding protein